MNQWLASNAFPNKHLHEPPNTHTQLGVHHSANLRATVHLRTSFQARAHSLSAATAPWPSATTSVRLHRPSCSQMSSCSLYIDDYLAEASPVLGRMRLDGLTETAVPFAERVVLLWRRGAPSPDMSADLLIDALKVWDVSSSMLGRRATRSACACCPGRLPPFEDTLAASPGPRNAQTDVMQVMYRG